MSSFLRGRMARKKSAAGAAEARPPPPPHVFICSEKDLLIGAKKSAVVPLVFVCFQVIKAHHLRHSYGFVVTYDTNNRNSERESSDEVARKGYFICFCATESYLVL